MSERVIGLRLRHREVLFATSGEFQKLFVRALAGTLHRHGVTEPAASLAAEAGVAVFEVGFERWIAGGEERELSRLTRESLDALKAVTAGR
ncbi:hypothetical protein [Streptomyces mirabilis]|uniref:hypothetical protein n=1 Tax=Streptomyces mirabilis TaxID=68239 RepID=UPI0036621D3D